MEYSISELSAIALRAAKEGRHQDADLCWQEVLRHDPDHVQALFSVAVHALQRAELSTARDHLLRARNVAPRDLLVLMTLASVYRFQKNVNDERDAIEAALVVDPYYLPGILAKAFWLQSHVGDVAAATMFRNALTLAPAEPDWPPVLRDQLAHAREFVSRYGDAYYRYLCDQVDDAFNALPMDARGRWKEATSILAGLTRPYTSQSNQLHIPRLPAIPFFEREQFPWAANLEEKTALIRKELEDLWSTRSADFSPYITYEPGQPVNQWVDLNHSDRWSSFHLWRAGERMSENLSRCPATSEALETIGLAQIGGLCPNAMFSVLAPHTRIPPHHGETNARAIAHLPLIVPAGCEFRVGFERRTWREGEILVFDDTLEHEAINDSDELRVVLIFDVWNPMISPAEQEMVRLMTQSARLFSGASSDTR